MKESLLPWVWTKRARRLGEVASNEPQGFSGPLRRVQREGSGFVEAPAFLTHPASPSQGRAGLGWAALSAGQAALRGATRDTADRKTEGQSTHLFGGGMGKSPPASNFPVTSLSFSRNSNSRRH